MLLPHVIPAKAGIQRISAPAARLELPGHPRHTAWKAAIGGLLLQQRRNEIIGGTASRGCHVLMICPRFQVNNFWNYSEACKLVGARYPAAPLGLITVAAMLPAHWQVRLVNRNTEELAEEDFA
jgi:hypothetical protein